MIHRPQRLLRLLNQPRIRSRTRRLRAQLRNPPRPLPSRPRLFSNLRLPPRRASPRRENYAMEGLTESKEQPQAAREENKKGSRAGRCWSQRATTIRNQSTPDPHADWGIDEESL